MDLKIDLLGCISVPYGLENHSNKLLKAIWPPAVSLRVQLLWAVLVNFGILTYFTNMALNCTKMHGFQISKAELSGIKLGKHVRLEKSRFCSKILAKTLIFTQNYLKNGITFFQTQI